MKENILQALFATVCGAIVAYLNILLVPFAVMIAKGGAYTIVAGKSGQVQEILNN